MVYYSLNITFLHNPTTFVQMDYLRYAKEYWNSLGIQCKFSLPSQLYQLLSSCRSTKSRSRSCSTAPWRGREAWAARGSPCWAPTRSKTISPACTPVISPACAPSTAHVITPTPPTIVRSLMGVVPIVTTVTKQVAQNSARERPRPETSTCVCSWVCLAIATWTTWKK